MNPEIKRVPDVVFKTRVRDESVEGPNPYRWQDRTTADILAVKYRTLCIARSLLLHAPNACARV